MAKRKLQMTAFSRFFLFLIIFLPSLFFGVSYLKGEDGIQNLKDMVGIESSESSNNESASSSTKPVTETFVNGEVKRLEDELEEKERRLKDLYQENELLRKQADDAKAELKEVTQQLETIKKAIG
ncbi:MAG: chromosome segregation ATPase [Granulosicoccus sp.]|jgi:chromosome segregation ATPase